MSILKQSVVYGFSNGLIAISQFGMSLMFSKVLSTDGFGMYSLFLVCYMAFSMLNGMGLPAAVQRYYFEMNHEVFKILLSTVIKAILYFSLLVALIILISPLSLSKYLLIEKKWILYSILTAMGQVFIQLILIVLQSQKRLGNYLILVLLQLFITVSASIAFFYYGVLTWQLAVFAQSASPLLTGVVVIIFIIQDGNKINTWSTILFRKAINYSFPLVPHQLSSWIMTMADRFIIGNFFGVGSVGVYSLSFQIAQSFNIVSNSLNQAVVPMLFQKLATPLPNLKEIKKINYFYLVSLCSFFLVFIVIFLQVSPYFITAEYKGQKYKIDYYN